MVKIEDFDRFITRLRYDYHKVVLFERFDKFKRYSITTEGVIKD